MRMRYRLIAVSTFLFGLGGCALLPALDRERSQATELLAYFHRLSIATPDIQRKEYADANVAYQLSPDDRTRTRLALVFLLPSTPWRDDVRAAQLLGETEHSANDRGSPRQDLIFLLEQITLTRRDDQRKCEQRMESIREERRKAEQKADSAREECKRAEVLQQKLDELRDIDRELRNRRPSQRTRP